MKPGASLSALVSVTARDGLELPPLDEPGAADELADRWANHGLRLVSRLPRHGGRRGGDPFELGPAPRGRSGEAGVALSFSGGARPDAAE